MFFKTRKQFPDRPPFHNLFMLVALMLLIYALYQSKDKYIPTQEQVLKKLGVELKEIPVPQDKPKVLGVKE